MYDRLGDPAAPPRFRDRGRILRGSPDWIFPILLCGALLASEVALTPRRLWEALKAVMPADQWIGFPVLLVALQSTPSLQGATGPSLEENARKALAQRLLSREIIWSGDTRWMRLSPAKHALVQAEVDSRLRKWDELRQKSNLDRVLPTTLKQLGIYRGQAGIYADRTRTVALSDGTVGVTVSVLHTGSAYPDDFGDEGAVYHYPKTGRPGASDRNEVQATKWAAWLRMPLFVISYPTLGATVREVRLGWVTRWNDESAIFHIAFGANPPAPLSDKKLPADEETFVLESDSPSIVRLSKARPGQAKFKFEVLRRYGHVCAVCDHDVPEVIDAAHILAKGQRGSDDARNGIPLCATHHRAFDANLFVIHPETLGISFPTARASRQSLRITRSSIAHLPAKPHETALRVRWMKIKAKNS